MAYARNLFNALVGRTHSTPGDVLVEEPQIVVPWNWGAAGFAEDHRLEPEEIWASSVASACVRVIVNIVSHIQLESSDRELAEELNKPGLIRDLVNDILSRGVGRLEETDDGLDVVAISRAGLVEGSQVQALNLDTYDVPDGPVPRVVSLVTPVRSLLMMDRIIQAGITGLMNKLVVKPSQGRASDGQPGRRAQSEDQSDSIKSQSQQGGNTPGFLSLKAASDVAALPLLPSLSPEAGAARERFILAIASGYGVPPFMVGSPGSEKFSNMADRYRALYADGVIPVLDNLVEHLSNEFDEDVYYSPESVISIDPHQATAIARDQVQAGIRSIREVRSTFLRIDTPDQEGVDDLAPSGNPSDAPADDPNPRGGEREDIPEDEQ